MVEKYKHMLGLGEKEQDDYKKMNLSTCTLLPFRSAVILGGVMCLPCETPIYSDVVRQVLDNAEFCR